MRQFVVLLVLAVASASANTIGWPGFPEGRIINGYEAQPGEAAYIISLQSNGNHFCAGSLIAPDVVLTAAHCLTNSKYTCVGAAHSRSNKDNVQVREVTKARHVIHESYGGGVGPYDIGLIFLEDPFDLNARNRDGTPALTTVSLPSKQFSAKTDGTLYGWGRDNSGSLPDKLQKLDVDIINYEECKANLPSNSKVHKTNVCSFTAGKADGACNGDSGGPLVSTSSNGDVEQVGIVSWGYTPCATTKYPSVYTSTASYTAWIKSTIEGFSG